MPLVLYLEHTPGVQYSEGEGDRDVLVIMETIITHHTPHVLGYCACQKYPKTID